MTKTWLSPGPIRRSPKGRDNLLFSRPVRVPLASVGLLPDLLPAPLWSTSAVHDEQARREDVSLPDVADRVSELPQPAGVRDPAPDAPRVQRHAARSAL